jgi:hypothetical protein
MSNGVTASGVARWAVPAHGGAGLTWTHHALHLAALRRLGHGVPLLSFDLRQAAAARALAITVLGA